MKRALISGDLGFLGGHFRRRLRQLDWTVLGFDIRGDVSIDAADFFREDKTPFDLALHLAAAIPNLESRALNPMPVASNLALDSLYFQWIMRAKPTSAVYFSSAAAYPIDMNFINRGLHESDIDLDDLRQPDGVYGLVKLVGEIQAREANRQGANVLVVRPQTGYGEDQSEDYPFRSIIERAKRHENPLTVWGSGCQVRDFVHVDDLVGAVLALLDCEVQGPVNIGTGIPTTLGQFAAMVANQASGYEPRIECDTTKPEGSRGRYADTTHMHLWYDHRVSLEEGIERALKL